MYDSVRGRLAAKDPAGCVVEAGGIGYAVLVPLSTYERLPATGAEVALKLHLAVREDDWRLFGFATDEERAVFRACLRVSGVGPVTALALLSGMPPRELKSAVAAGDVRALVKVKGVGKKTAERLVVELKDAFGPSAFGASKAAGVAVAPEAGLFADAMKALIALGLDPEEAATRVRAHWKGEGTPLSDLVRSALRS
jgi:Holliday junction DNA helicase RuvA